MGTGVEAGSPMPFDHARGQVAARNRSGGSEPDQSASDDDVVDPFHECQLRFFSSKSMVNRVANPGRVVL